MKYFFTILLVAVCGFSFGQRCVTNDYLTLSADRSAQRTFSNGEANITGRDTLADEVIIIPVVVHVLYNNSIQNISDERIKAQINALNRDFRRRNADTVNTPAPFKNLAADTKIAFCLANVDPNGFKTTGIIRKQTKEKLFLADDQMKYSSKGGDDAWDASRYLNIWVCDLFGRTLAYSSMPGGSLLTDGIVIQYGVVGDEKSLSGAYNMGRTLTHETGHWLGLKHIWGDVEDQGCGDDGIADTPPQSHSSNGCNTFPKLSACSVNEYGDMFMNYMDFTDDACMNMFTIGQKNKMRSQFAKGCLRNSFLDSDLCDGSDAQEAPQVPEKKLSIKVYPNPVAEQLFVDFDETGSQSAKMLTIYNIQGKLLIKKAIQGPKESVSLSSYPNGMYIVTVSDGGLVKTFKILKQSNSGR